MSRVWLVALLVACKSAGPSQPATGSGSAPTVTPDAAVPIACTALPFAETTSVPEASGAAWIDIDGTPQLVVISDSGNRGAYGIVDPETGATSETGRLPLPDDSIDLEGVAAQGGTLWAITSPGWVVAWQRAPGGWQRITEPYALGPIDLTGKRGAVGDRPPAGDGMVCDAGATNCGRNYEGLCLAPSKTASRCVGFAAAKADGHLYCLVERDGKLAVDRAGAIRIARPGVVADCAFSPSGALYVGSNLFDLGEVYAVDGWQEPASARVRSIAALGVGFPETLAVRDDVIYRMSDMGNRSPSAMKKFRCTGL